jgi:hypothetical protein
MSSIFDDADLWLIGKLKSKAGTEITVTDRQGESSTITAALEPEQTIDVPSPNGLKQLLQRMATMAKADVTPYLNMPVTAEGIEYTVTKLGSETAAMVTLTLTRPELRERSRQGYRGNGRT